MQDRLGEVRIEAVDRLDLAADPVVAERDLALQAAEVGHVDRQRVVVVGLELADVVEQRAGHRDVAVDAGEERGRGADALRHRERVLEQTVAVGLVVVLGGRRVAEALPDLAARRQESVEQLAQLGGLDRLEQRAQVGLEPLERDRRGLEQIGGVVLVLARPGARPRRSPRRPTGRSTRSGRGSGRSRPAPSPRSAPRPRPRTWRRPSRSGPTASARATRRPSWSGGGCGRGPRRRRRSARRQRGRRDPDGRSWAARCGGFSELWLLVHGVLQDRVRAGRRARVEIGS